MLVRKEDRRERRRLLHFPKGRPDGALSAEETALREVQEETGYKAEILGRVPGVFPGGTGQNVFFLMQPIGPAGKHDTETQSIRWVDPAEAAKLIQQTTNKVGRQRDLSVLEASLSAYRSLRQEFSKPWSIAALFSPTEDTAIGASVSTKASLIRRRVQVAW